MADNGMNITLSVDFEEYGNVEKKLKLLIDKLQKSNKLNINVDPNAFKEVQKQFDEFKDKLKGLDIDGKGLDSFSQVFKVSQGEAEGLVQTTKKFTNELNQAVKVVENFDKNTKDITSRTTTLTNEYSKAYKEAESSLIKQYQLKNQLLKAGDNEKVAIQEELTKMESVSKELYKQLDLTNLVKLKQKEDTLQNKLGAKTEDLTQNTVYTQASKSLKEQFDLKTKLLTADENEKVVLQELLAKEEAKMSPLLKQLDLTNQIKIKQQEISSQNNLEIKTSGGLDKYLKDIDNFTVSANEKIDALKQRFGEVLNTPKFNEEIAILKNKMDGIKLDPSKFNLSEIKEQFKSLTSEMEHIGDIDKAKQKIDSFTNGMAEDITRLKIKYKELVPGNEVLEIEELMNKLKGSETNSLNDIGKEIDNIKLKYKQMETEIKGSGTQTGQKDTQGLLSMGTKNLFKFASWQIIGDFYMRLIGIFKDGITYTNQLNDAFTQISIVTGKNQEQVKRLGEEYSFLAKTMSVTTKEIADASVEFYRQGLSQSQVMDRLKETTKYAKISSLDFKQSAEILTSTVNGMGVTAQKASDVFAYLGDATATGADEIGIAMQKVAGSASVANISLEKVSSWISEISSKTREAPESIGSSLNTMISRYNSIRENGFNEEDGTKLNDITKALTSVGIQATDSQGQLINFADSIDTVGSKFSSLDKKSQSYLATTIAGVRQQDKFLNLMNGYKDSLSLYEGAMNSAGTAQQKYDLWTQGTTAHLNQLKTVGTDIWSKMFNSKDINNGINLLVGLGNAIKSMFTLFGTLPSMLGIASAGLMLFNIKFREFGVTLVPNAIAKIKLLTTSSNQLGTSFSLLPKIFATSSIATKELGHQVEWLGFSFNTATIKAIGLKVAMGAMTAGLSILAGFALQKLIEGLDSWIHRAEKLKQLNSDLAQSTKDTAKTISEIEGLLSKSSSLEDQIVNAKTIEESTKLKAELLEVQKQIAGILPESTTGFDNEGNAIATNNKIVQEQIDLKKQEMVLNAQSFFDKNGGIEKIKETAEAYAKEKKEYEELKLAQAQGKKTITKTGIGADEHGNEIEVTYEINVAKALEEKNKKMQESTTLMSQAVIQANALNKYNGQNIDTTQFFTDTINKNTLSKKSNLEITQQYSDAINSEEASQKKLADSFDDVTSKLQFLTKAQSEYNENGKFSGDTLQQLISKYPELINYMDNQALLYDKIGEKVVQEENTQKNSFNAKLMMSAEFKNKMEKDNSNMFAEINKKYGEDLSKYATLAEGKLAIEKKLAEEIIKAQTKVRLAKNISAMDINDPTEVGIIKQFGVDSQNQLGALQQEAGSIGADFDAIVNKFTSKVSFDPINSGSSSASKDKSSKSSSPAEIQSINNEMDATKTALSEVTDLIALQEKSLTNLSTTAKKYADAKDYSNAIESENKLLTAQQAHQKELQTALAKTDTIKNKIKSAFYNQGISGVEELTPSQLEEIWNSRYGGNINFGTGDNAKKAKESFEAQGKVLKTLIDDWKSWGDTADKVSQSIIDNNNDIYQSMTDIKNVVKDNISSVLEKSIFGGSTQKEFENTHKAIINGLQDQLETMDKINTAQEENEERLKRQNDLTKIQTELTNTLKEKNIRELTENIDGTYEWKYVADQTKVNDLQTQYSEKLKDNQEWEEGLIKAHNKQKIQDQIDYQNDLIAKSNEAYADMKEDIELALDDQSITWGNGFTTLEGTIGKSLENMGKLYGDKFTQKGGILDIIKTNVALANSALAGYDATLAGTNRKSITVNTEIDKEMLQKEYGSTVDIKVDYGSGERGADRYETLEMNKKKLGRLKTGGQLSEWGNQPKLALLDQGEVVIKSPIIKALEKLPEFINSDKNILSTFVSKLNLPDFSKLSIGNASKVLKSGDTNYNFSFDKVVTENVDDFVRQAKAYTLVRV